MIDSGDKLKLDQTHLETVIPAPGKSFCRLFDMCAINIRAIQSSKQSFYIIL